MLPLLIGKMLDKMFPILPPRREEEEAALAIGTPAVKQLMTSYQEQVHRLPRRDDGRGENKR